MAEPQRASALPDAPQRSRLAPKPRPPHPYYAAPLRLPLDATQDLSPTARAVEPAGLPPPIEPEAEPPAAPRRDGRTRHAVVPRLSSRPPGEWVLMAVVLLGLTLNASSCLTSDALSRSDRLLGSAVFLVGLALLVLMEVCRRTGRTSR
jgi:hypothetical protein